MLPIHGPGGGGEPVTPGEAGGLAGTPGGTPGSPRVVRCRRGAGGERPSAPGVVPVPRRLLGGDGGETGPPALGKGCPWMVEPTDDPLELGPVPTEPMLEPGAALEGELGVEPGIGEVMLLLPIGLLGMPGGFCAPVMGAAPPELVCA